MVSETGQEHLKYLSFTIAQGLLALERLFVGGAEGYGWSWFMCRDRPFPGVTFRKEFTRGPFYRSQWETSSSLAWWKSKSHCWPSYLLLIRGTPLHCNPKKAFCGRRAGLPLGAAQCWGSWEELLLGHPSSQPQLDTRPVQGWAPRHARLIALRLSERRGQAFLRLWVHPALLDHSSPGDVWKDRPSPFLVDVEELGDCCEAVCLTSGSRNPRLLTRV